MKIWVPPFAKDLQMLVSVEFHGDVYRILPLFAFQNIFLKSSSTTAAKDPESAQQKV